MSKTETDMSNAPRPSHTARTEASDLLWRVEHDGVPVAESTDVVLVLENYNGTELTPVPYFPLSDVRSELLEPSELTTHCPVKGSASYYSVRVNDTTVEDGVWYYPEPLEGVAALAGHVGFYGDRFSIRSRPVEGE
jgi:uncharacterized protein (DUF427 family)